MECGPAVRPVRTAMADADLQLGELEILNEVTSHETRHESKATNFPTKFSSVFRFAFVVLRADRTDF